MKQCDAGVYSPSHMSPTHWTASQGPIPDSMAAFWQMVWLSGSTCIVMVTNEIEGNKMKCHRYWPARESPTETYGYVMLWWSSKQPVTRMSSMIWDKNLCNVCFVLRACHFEFEISRLHVAVHSSGLNLFSILISNFILVNNDSKI